LDEAGGHRDWIVEQDLGVGFALGIISQRGRPASAENIVQEKINRVRARQIESFDRSLQVMRKDRRDGLRRQRSANTAKGRQMVFLERSISASSRERSNYCICNLSLWVVAQAFRDD
jgi:hypothetical protein